MASLTANDLKTRGIAAIEESLANRPEAMISVRGKDRFVVMAMAHYHHLRECELDAALAQSEADLAAGRYVVESAGQHVARVEALLASEPGAPAFAVARSGAKPGRAAAKKPRGRPSVR